MSFLGKARRDENYPEKSIRELVLLFHECGCKTCANISLDP